MEIPEEILGMNTYLDVLVDVMFVNKLKFKTIKYTPNRSEKELAQYFNKILDVYKNKASQSILCIWTLNLTI